MTPRRLRHLAWALTAATIGCQIGWVLAPAGPVRDGFTIAGVLLFAAASFTAAWATAGLSWAIRFFTVVATLGWAVEALGTTTGFPFGAYDYAQRLGPTLGPVPLVIPLAWAMMGYPAYAVAARACRTRPGRIGCAAALLATWDLFLDPQMVAEGHWVFADPTPALPGVPGIPLTNFAGWALTALVVMTVADRLAGPPTPAVADRSPAVVLLGWVYLSNVLANAVFFGRPAVALVGAVGMGIPMTIAIRGLRRHPVTSAQPDPVVTA